MSTARKVHHTYESYLQALELSPLRLEYLDGEIYAMAGGSPAHADLSAAMIAVLVNGLGNECRVSTSDLKVRIEATDLSTFPDVTVVCGKRETSALDPHAVTNPTLIVEVTSPSTEDYDRGEKLRHYKHLPSLQTVIFVSHRRAQLTILEKSNEEWQEREANSNDIVVLRCPQVTFEVARVYRGVELDANS